MNDLERAAGRMVCVGFAGTQFTSELRELLERGVSSVILFTRNYESPAALAELCSRIKNSVDRPVMICIDQEGGRVQRLREPFTIIPSMRELGRRGDVEAVRRVGHVMARELRAVNVDMNLAPVLDVDSNPDNPVIGERSFGNYSAVVGRLGGALIQSMQAAGLAACGKHFPGHGDTSVDSHLDLPRLPHDRTRLNAVELPPFRAAIKCGVAAIMCAHILFDAIDPVCPATMSGTVVQQLLRAELGFEGTVCSDDLEMKAILDHFGIEEAVTRGVAAGIDLFLVCQEHALQHRAIDALAQAAGRRGRCADAVRSANARLDALFAGFVRPASSWTERSIQMFEAAQRNDTTT